VFHHTGEATLAQGVRSTEKLRARDMARCHPSAAITIWQKC